MNHQGKEMLFLPSYIKIIGKIDTERKKRKTLEASLGYTGK